jgi:hypothetical protein
VKDGLEHVYSLLKGSDAAVYQSLRTLGLKPVLYLDYRYSKRKIGGDTVLLDSPYFEGFYGVDDLYEVFQSFSGIMIPSDEEVTWVTPRRHATL